MLSARGSNVAHIYNVQEKTLELLNFALSK